MDWDHLNSNNSGGFNAQHSRQNQSNTPKTFRQQILENARKSFNDSNHFRAQPSHGKHDNQKPRNHKQEILHCEHEQCDYTTTRLDSLITHYRKHTGDLFKCTHPGCDYETARSAYLKNHSRQHTGEKLQCNQVIILFFISFIPIGELTYNNDRVIIVLRSRVIRILCNQCNLILELS